MPGSFTLYITPKLSVIFNEGSWKVWWVTGIPLKHRPALPSTLAAPPTPTLFRLLAFPSPLLDSLSLTFHSCTLSFSDFLLPWITVGAKLKVCVCFVHAFALDPLLWCHVACGGLLLYNKHWTMKTISSSMRSYKSESSSSVICLSDFLPALQHTQTAKRHLRMTRS